MGLQADFTGVWNMNREYNGTAFSGIRPVFQIMDNYMTLGIIEGNDRFENGEIVRVTSPSFATSHLGM